MGLTIDEAIKHAKEVAETNMYKAKTYDDDFLKRFHTNTDKCKQCAEEHEQLAEWLEKLKAYEQAEEDGLLIRLPCKVGDAVYFTDRKYDRENRVFVPFVHNGYVKAIKFSARPTKVTIEYEDLDDSHGRCKGHDIHASNIGKTVFLTKAEAEQALAKMKGV